MKKEIHPDYHPVVFRDIGERRDSDRLRWELIHDPLTGLANRHALVKHFATLKEHGPLCVAFIDLDDFKAVNDAFGHRSGDELLIQLSQRLRGSCPEGTIVGRLGGDEFVLLLPFPLSSLLVNSAAHTCLRAALMRPPAPDTAAHRKKG